MHKLNKNLIDLSMSGIRLFNQQASKVDNAIVLTIGEPTFTTPENIKQAAIDAFNNNQTKYPPFQGYPSLLSAIRDFEYKTQNILYQDEEILITQGATGAIYNALGSICNPDDEVIIFDPAYIAYEPAIEIFHAKTIRVDTSEDDFQLSYEKIVEKITNKTKAIIVNSPNNPTGVIYNNKSIEILKRIIDEFDIYIITDDVYNQITYTDADFIIRHQSHRDRLIYCQSFSKPYSMTGWRIGYMLAPKEIIKNALKVQQFVSAGVASFIQIAAIEALKTDVSHMSNYYRENLDAALKLLDQHQISYLKPQGAFYLFVNIKNTSMSSWEFCEQLLNKHKVAVIPGSVFSKTSDDFIRVSFGANQKDLIEGLNRLITFIKET